jgi:hypothetical protein
LDVSACEHSYNNPADSSHGTPKLEGLQFAFNAAQTGIAQAMQRLGLHHERIELHTAVAALLSDPGCIERWRSLLKPRKPQANL